jgi:hypothetical protein
LSTVSLFSLPSAYSNLYGSIRTKKGNQRKKWDEKKKPPKSKQKKKKNQTKKKLEE